MLKRSWVTLCWLVFLVVYGSLPAAVHTIPVSAAQSLAPVPGVNLQSQSQVPAQTSGYATAPNLRFDRLSVDDGLSFSFTTSILQDRQGFMWFGTRYGLNQFDGFDFSVHMLGSSGDVLFANYIRNMYQDRTGDLWISNLVDLVCKDHETGEFVHYKPDATNPQSLWPGQLYAIAEDAAGNLWISTTDGLNRYEPSTDTFTHHLTGVSVLSFMADRQGGTWIGTGGYGLWHFPPGSPVQGQPKKYLPDPSDPNSLSDTMVLSVIEDHEGILWVGTFDGGLNRLDPTTGKFTRFQHDPQDPLSLSHNNVNTILEDSRGRLWIGTDDGLNLFDRKTGRFFQYHHNPGDPHSLSSDTVWEIYEDRSGVLWFGTLNGISKLNETASRFTHYQQTPNPPAQGWGAQSVTVLDAPTAPGLSDNAVSAVYQDRQGLLWIGTNTTYRGELNRLDRSTGRVTVYQYNPDDPSSLTNGPVYTVYEDSAGTLWVGTLDGLARFHPQTQSFRL